MLQKHNVLSINYLNGIMCVISLFRNTYVSFLYFCDFFYITFWFIVTATSKTWTQTLDPGKPGHRKPGCRKSCTLENLDPEKPVLWKTWTLKNMDHEKHGINMLCVKSVQIRIFFWSIFSRISSYSVRMRENAVQKKLRIWRLFTQWWD